MQRQRHANADPRYADDQAVATTLTAGSFRFNAVWYVCPSGEADEASGERVAPNRYHATQLGTEVIPIGDMTYIRPLTDDAWTGGPATPGAPQPHDSVNFSAMANLSVEVAANSDHVRVLGYGQLLTREGPPYLAPYAVDIDPVTLLIHRMIGWVDWIQPDRQTRLDAAQCLASGVGYQDCPRAETTLSYHGAPITIDPPPGF